MLEHNPGEKSLKTPFVFYIDLECIFKKKNDLVKTTQKNFTQKKKLDMSLLVGQFLQDVHLIKNKINLIITEEKSAMKIIGYEKKEMIPLTHEENNFYIEQEACHICKEKFCTGKGDKNYINKKRLKIIVIILENSEGLPIVNAI